MAGQIKEFRALKPLRKELKIQLQARQEVAAEQLRLAQQLVRESELFSQKVGPVFPIKPTGNRLIPQYHPKPYPVISHKMPHEGASLRSAILQASLSDLFSIENLVSRDDPLRFARNGVGNDVLAKLHRGHWAVRQQLDLHGLRIDQARDTLAEFIQLANKRRWRCVRVIHGKGFGSVNQIPVLKGKVRDWLVQIDSVVAFCQASEVDGGSGAIVVLLKAQLRD